MSSPVASGMIAVIGGVVVAALLFVPFVAVQVRRYGSLTLGRTLVALTVPVYALALVTYTLLPLPSDIVALCIEGGAGVQLRPGQFALDIVREQSTSPGLLRNPAVQQFALNVALFLPLGVLVRLLLSRGAVVTLLVGVGASALIELTQVTGVWGLYPCAYRLLDVDDLIANTSGVLVGWLVAPLLAFLRRGDGLAPAAPRALTRRRRLLGMLCDVVIASWVTLVITAIYSAITLTATGLAPAAHGAADIIIGLGVALSFLGTLLWTSRTPGETVVRLRPQNRPSVPGAVVRWSLGIGGFLLLQLLAPDSILDAVFAFITIVGVLFTSNHRGLAYRVLEWQIEDDRAPHTRSVPLAAGNSD
ncbi:VanZ family protein [Lacisediminihabitans sp. FW035]